MVISTLITAKKTLDAYLVTIHDGQWIKSIIKINKIINMYMQDIVFYMKRFKSTNK